MNQSTSKSRLKTLTLSGTLAAMYAVAAQLSIPMPFGVPMTLQCFIIALGAYACGAKVGIMSTLVYIGAGAVGLPVFASMKGGIGTLAGVTGGFIWGFIPLAFICGAAGSFKAGRNAASSPVPKDKNTSSDTALNNPNSQCFSPCVTPACGSYAAKFNAKQGFRSLPL